MEKEFYIRLSENQLDKIGNAIIYLSNKIGKMSKTKTLKLLYILDELSIKKSGIPFFNLKYKVWKFGPVSEEIYIDLTSELVLLKKYIRRKVENETNLIEPIAEFSDDEFSDNDIELMDFVVDKFGNKTAKNLVAFTHRKNAPWHTTALRNSVLELLETEQINNTELLVDMSTLVAHDERKKALYNDFIELN